MFNSTCEFSCKNVDISLIQNNSTNNTTKYRKNINRPYTSTPEEYITQNVDFILYVMDISYFSGKMEMYCRYKELNYIRIEPTFLELHEIAKYVSNKSSICRVYGVCVVWVYVVCVVVVVL